MEIGRILEYLAVEGIDGNSAIDIPDANHNYYFLFKVINKGICLNSLLSTKIFPPKYLLQKE